MVMDHAEDEKQNIRAPPGVRLITKLKCINPSHRFCQTSVLIITFVAYACYHASRKPPSIVKGALDPESKQSATLQTISHLSSPYPWPLNHIFIKHTDPRLFKLEGNRSSIPRNDSNSPSGKDGWAPFNERDGTARLGEIDVAFLAVYSLGMYFAGHLGDRLDLRIFLTLGMVGSGMFVASFGLGYWLKIHNFYFYLGVQMIAMVWNM